MSHVKENDYEYKKAWLNLKYLKVTIFYQQHVRFIFNNSISSHSKLNMLSFERHFENYSKKRENENKILYI